MVGGHYCCVVGCQNSMKKHSAQGIKFHRFPANEARRQLWIQAVKREQDDRRSSKWSPGPGKRKGVV